MLEASGKIQGYTVARKFKKSQAFLKAIGIKGDKKKFSTVNQLCQWYPGHHIYKNIYLIVVYVCHVYQIITVHWIFSATQCCQYF